MPTETWEFLNSEAQKLGIDLQVDIFGLKSLELASYLGLQTIKVHPTDATNEGLLDAIENSAIERILLGIGGSRRDEIDFALSRLKSKNVVLLLGFQGYPTPTNTNQIHRVAQLVDEFSSRHPSVTVGFADHASPDSGLAIPLGAMAIGSGARLIEKHITLNRVIELEDFESAINADEFEEYVSILQNTYSALGAPTDSNDYDMSEEERIYRTKIRRHVVTARDIKKGEQILPSDLLLKRTSSISPITDLGDAANKIASTNLAINNAIELNDLL
jgi:N,N'-diacetyllegionaminate synthase